MSISNRRGRARRGDAGFSLVEIVVAMGLLMVVLTASLPMLLSMLRSTVTTKMNTQGKNLAQERLEQLRDLRFHVDRQNGPFLDLLDLYYTNASSAGTPTTITSGAGTLTGRYVASGTSNGIAAPLYEVSTGSIAGATQFSQVVVAQFLGAGGTVLPASRFQNVYDSQVVGRDTPPSLMVRFTAITTWVQAGVPKSYRVTTVLTEGPPESPVIQTQAKAVAVSVNSTAADASTLQVQGGVATLDGAQSSGSSVSGYITGAIATRTGAAAVTGEVGQFSLPSQGLTTTGPGGAQGGGGCSWFGFGPNAVSNVTADVATGLPKAPANVDAAVPLNVSTGAIRQGTSNACGMLSFDNLTGGGTARSTADLLGFEMGAAPYARVPDTGTSATGLAGSGYVTASALTVSPQQAKAGGRVAMAQPVVLFPNNPESSGQGLVSARLSQAAVDCVSGRPGSVVGSYTLELGWWGQGSTDSVARWHTATWNYNSAAATPLTVSGDAWEPATTMLGNGSNLGQLVQVAVPSSTEGRVTTGATTGLRGFASGVLTLTTAPTLTNESGLGHSAIKVQLGQLTCVADDNR